MAERLARIFGTEEDKVNCPFYYKIGACRHGDRCSKLHNKPLLSQTIIIPHMYENPPAAVAFSEGIKVPEDALKEAIRHFEDFYEEVFNELCRYGELEGLYVCDNVGDHLMGNVYAKFYREDDAGKALAALNGRYYAGKILHCEFSPVTYFRAARCKQYDEQMCNRGGYCNYMHLKHVSRTFKKSLFKQMYEDYPEYRKRRKDRMTERGASGSRPRSHKGKHSKSRSRSKSRSHGGSRSKHRSKKRSRSRSRSKERNFFKKTSEERRAMVAKWAKEDEERKTGDVVPDGGVIVTPEQKVDGEVAKTEDNNKKD